MHPHTLVDDKLQMPLYEGYAINQFISDEVCIRTATVDMHLDDELVSDTLVLRDANVGDDWPIFFSSLQP